MRQYEMTYLLSDQVGDNEITAVTGKINALITKQEGKILGEENWGRRKLAYPIKKQDFATYLTLNFELDPAKLSTLSGELKHRAEILRHLLIVKDYGKEKLELTADEVAETEDIEEVVGGEKSFEAIEGETEESYDLMAKREEEKESEEDKISQPDSDEKKSKKEKVDQDNKTDKQKGAKEHKLEDASEIEKVNKEIKEPSKPKKKKGEKEKTEDIEENESKTETEEQDTAKPAKKKVVKKPSLKKEPKAEKSDKDKNAEAEADRLAKLDEEIEGILGDDL